jgi:hypothetical protein
MTRFVCHHLKLEEQHNQPIRNEEQVSAKQNLTGQGATQILIGQRVGTVNERAESGKRKANTSHHPVN